MDEDLVGYQREFELRFLKSRGAAFQDLFSDLMEKAHPGDFCRVRAHGRTGDMKCDGYLTSTQGVFQVYGPDDMRNVSRLLRKMEDDFCGAAAAWDGQVASWTLVHNSQSGLPPQAVQRLANFRDRAPNLRIAAWGFEELRQVLRILTPDALRALLPAARATSTPREDAPSMPTEAAMRSYWSWLDARLDASASRWLGENGYAFPLRVVDEATAGRLRSIDDRLAGTGARRAAWHDAVPRAPDRQALLKDGATVEKLSALLRPRRCVFVLGEPGSGKSTLLASYARLRLETLRTRGFKKGVGRTPVLLELWTADQSRSLFETIVLTINSGDGRIGLSETVALLARGYLLLLLDGLDEVPAERRRGLLAQIVDLARKFPRCHVVVSTRRLPDVPLDFHAVEVAPLEDSVVTRAFSLAVKARRIAGHAEDTETLTPALQRLCYRPLTLSLLTSAVARGEILPKTLFATYERFLAWTLGWDHRRERLASVAAATGVLEDVAQVLLAKGRHQLPLTDWTRIASETIRRLRAEGTIDAAVVEDVLRQILLTGVVRDTGGEYAFAHRTLMEFLAARAISRQGPAIEGEPIALDRGVARFICGSGVNVERILEQHLKRCSDVKALLPLLVETVDAEGDCGRFEELEWAICFAEEIGIHLDFLRRDGMQAFGDDVEGLIAVCLSFGAKALSVLKDAAEGIAHCIVYGANWSEARGWFEEVVTGLEALGWAEAALLRQILFEFLELRARDDSASAEEALDEIRDLLGMLAGV